MVALDVGHERWVCGEIEASGAGRARVTVVVAVAVAGLWPLVVVGFGDPVADIAPAVEKGEMEVVSWDCWAGQAVSDDPVSGLC